GKVVIKMRDEEMDRQPLKAIKPAVDMMVTVKTYFHPNKVYIITGGLGGMGREMIPWMQNLGARKFIVTSRTSIKNNYIKFLVNRFRNDKHYASEWLVSTADCITTEGTQQLLKEAQKLGPIGGVFHLAVNLSDGFVANHTIDTFGVTIDVKAKILVNLDQLSRQLTYNLDYFVAFTSIGTGKGSASLTNYGYGNSMCERICEARRRDGLHGLAVQLGPIAGVGMVEYLEHRDEIYRVTALKQVNVHSYCELLDTLLAINTPVVTGFGYQDTQIATHGTRQSRMIEDLWHQLGIDPDDTPSNVTIGDIGVESLFAVEIQHEFERQWRVQASLYHVRTINIGMLKEFGHGDYLPLKNHLEAMISLSHALSNQVFIIASDECIKLNNITTGRPIYIMPTLTTNFSTFADWAQKHDRPVIGLNWTRDLNKLSSLTEVNEHFEQLLRRLEPNGAFDVVGHFDSGPLCVSLARAEWATVNAVIVDAFDELKLGDDNDQARLSPDVVIKVAVAEFPEAVRATVVRDINNEPDLNRKIGVIVKEMLDIAGKVLPINDIKEIFQIMYARILILSEFTMDKRTKVTMEQKLSLNMTGKLTIVKPLKIVHDADVRAVIDKTLSDYFLPNNKITGPRYS
ncbi:unnamed protein product, partial [Oppiella nova]